MHRPNPPGPNQQQLLLRIRLLKRPTQGKSEQRQFFPQWEEDRWRHSFQLPHHPCFTPGVILSVTLAEAHGPLFAALHTLPQVSAGGQGSSPSETAGSGVIYCPSPRFTQEIHACLQAHPQRIPLPGAASPSLSTRRCPTGVAEDAMSQSRWP